MTEYLRKPTSQTTGRDLAAEREAVGVSASDIAREMGVTRQRISQLEYQVAPVSTSIKRYRAAIDRVLEGRTE